MLDNTLLFALFSYGVAIVIALLVGGIVSLIHWVVKPKGKKAAGG